MSPIGFTCFLFQIYTFPWVDLLLQCIALLLYNALWHRPSHADSGSKIIAMLTASVWVYHGKKRGLWSTHFQIRFPPNLGPPSNSGFQGLPFQPLSITLWLLWNCPNSGIDEGHIWVWSAIQTNRKQNACNRKDFAHWVRLLNLCDYRNAQTSNLV